LITFLGDYCVSLASFSKMTVASKPQVQRFSADADPSQVWKAIEGDGVAIMTGVVPKDQIRRFTQEIEPQVAKTPWEISTLGRKFPPHSKMLNDLVANSAAYRNDIITNPVMHEICKAAFKPTGDYWMSSGVLRVTRPQHEAQIFHRDALSWPLLRERAPELPPLTITVIIPTTDFTAANGATRVILGSHRWSEVGEPSEDQAVLTEMKEGDMMVMRQGLVHGGGKHTPKAPDDRGMLLLFFNSCQLSQFESALALPRSLVESMSPLAQKMVGWRTLQLLDPYSTGLNTYRSRPLEDGLNLQADQPLK
jgi:verruculogen synthase